VTEGLDLIVHHQVEGILVEELFLDMGERLDIVVVVHLVLFLHCYELIRCRNESCISLLIHKQAKVSHELIPPSDVASILNIIGVDVNHFVNARATISSLKSSVEGSRGMVIDSTDVISVVGL